MPPARKSKGKEGRARKSYTRAAHGIRNPGHPWPGTGTWLGDEKLTDAAGADRNLFQYLSLPVSLVTQQQPISVTHRRGAWPAINGSLFALPPQAAVGRARPWPGPAVVRVEGYR